MVPLPAPCPGRMRPGARGAGCGVRVYLNWKPGVRTVPASRVRVNTRQAPDQAFRVFPRYPVPAGCTVAGQAALAGGVSTVPAVRWSCR